MDRTKGPRKQTLNTAEDVAAVIGNCATESTYQSLLQDTNHPSARNRRWARNLRPSDWRNVSLPPYQKDFYREHTRTAQRSSEKVEAYRNANGVIVTGRDVPKPILHLDEAGLPQSLTQAIENLNSDSSLTTLQAQCWPVVLSRRYLVAVDRTASKWKSLAYLVPALIHVRHQPSVLDDWGPTVVVLTLTRGVALQVQTTVQEFTKKSGIRTMYILCGNAKLPQVKQLREGAICVAPPGRLTAFMKEGKVNMGRCTHARDGLRQESSGHRGRHTTGPTEAREADDILRHDSNWAVVYVERQQMVEYLASTLRIKGWPAVGIHGKKTEREHEWALSALRSGKVSVLLATDVATKAMELDNVRFVVSYDHPVHSSDYRRRFGHEIRPDATGRFYTFLAPDNHVRARELMRLFRENKQHFRQAYVK
ncbi:hypothetical protein MTO96_004905 [Rhipicephalus appendiculatus]